MNPENISIKPIQSKVLIKYLESRAIPLSLAQSYLKEIHYIKNSKKYRTLAFDLYIYGCSLSNKYFGGSSIIKKFIEIPGTRNELDIFIGVVDFLSDLVYHRSTKPINTVYVMDSLLSVPNTILTIKKFDKINLYLPNDTTSNYAIKEYELAHSNVYNVSKSLYKNFKTYNDFLIDRAKHQ